MRRAFAHGVDARVGGGLHGVAHDDAPVDVQAHRLGQGRVGADAHGHDHQIGRDFAAVLEAHGLHAASGVAQQRLGLRLHQECHAALLQSLLQHLPGRGIQLAIEQPFARVHHRHLHPALHQAIGRLQPEQAAANHHGVPVLRSRVDHGLRIGNVAVGQHAVQILAGNRQHEGVGAGGQNQPVVGHADGLARAAHRLHGAPGTVHLGHGAAGVQGDAVLGIPRPVVEHDLLQRLLPRQHGREQDAVVVGMRLRAEDGDLVQIGRDLQQLFERAHPRHAIAHHHQLHFFHSALLQCSSTAQSGHEHNKATTMPMQKPAYRPLSKQGLGGRCTPFFGANHAATHQKPATEACVSKRGSPTPTASPSGRSPNNRQAASRLTHRGCPSAAPKGRVASSTVPKLRSTLSLPPFLRGQERRSPAGARPGQQNQNQANNKK